MIEKTLNISFQGNPLEGQRYMKFCDSCLSESKEIYLKREHQIPGNMICWKHKEVLKRIPYNVKNGYLGYIDFVRHISDNKNNLVEIETVDLDEDKFQMACELADFIHLIFTDGLKEDLYAIEAKIRQKLNDMSLSSYVRTGKIIEVSNFEKQYNRVSVIKPLDMGEILHSLMNNKSHPIILLQLIALLFDSIESYLNYELREDKFICDFSYINYTHLRK